MLAVVPYGRIVRRRHPGGSARDRHASETRGSVQAPSTGSAGCTRSAPRCVRACGFDVILRAPPTRAISGKAFSRAHRARARAVPNQPCARQRRDDDAPAAAMAVHTAVAPIAAATSLRWPAPSCAARWHCASSVPSIRQRRDQPPSPGRASSSAIDESGTGFGMTSGAAISAPSVPRRLVQVIASAEGRRAAVPPENGRRPSQHLVQRDAQGRDDRLRASTGVAEASARATCTSMRAERPSPVASHAPVTEPPPAGPGNCCIGQAEVEDLHLAIGG